MNRFTSFSVPAVLTAALVALTGCGISPGDPSESPNNEDFTYTTFNNHYVKSIDVADRDEGFKAAWLDDGRTIALITWQDDMCGYYPGLQEKRGDALWVNIRSIFEPGQNDECNHVSTPWVMSFVLEKPVDVTKDLELNVTHRETDYKILLEGDPRLRGVDPQVTKDVYAAAGWFNGGEGIALEIDDFFNCGFDVTGVEVSDRKEVTVEIRDNDEDAPCGSWLGDMRKTRYLEIGDLVDGDDVVVILKGQDRDGLRIPVLGMRPGSIVPSPTIPQVQPGSLLPIIDGDHFVKPINPDERGWSVEAAWLGDGRSILLMSWGWEICGYKVVDYSFGKDILNVELGLKNMPEGACGNTRGPWIEVVRLEPWQIDQAKNLTLIAHVSDVAHLIEIRGDRRLKSLEPNSGKAPVPTAVWFDGLSDRDVPDGSGGAALIVPQESGCGLQIDNVQVNNRSEIVVTTGAGTPVNACVEGQAYSVSYLDVGGDIDEADAFVTLVGGEHDGVRIPVLGMRSSSKTPRVMP